MRAALARLIISAMLATGGVLVFAQSSEANSTCTTHGPQGAFNGNLSDSLSANYGVVAAIDIPNVIPGLCLSKQSFTDGWVMVASYQQGQTPGYSSQAYAQIGYGRDFLHDNFGPNEVDRLLSFAQYTQACSPNCGGIFDGLPDSHTNVFPAPDFGTSLTYSDQQRPSDGKIHMDAGARQYFVTPYNGKNTWQANWQGQFFNESGFLQDDVWGTPSDRDAFHGIKRYLTGGGSVYVSSLTPIDRNPDAWGNASYTPTNGLAFKLWSK